MLPGDFKPMALMSRNLTYWSKSVQSKKNTEQPLQRKPETITGYIFFIRGEKVLVDFVLAQLYDVEVRVLKRTVRRNIEKI